MSRLSVADQTLRTRLEEETHRLQSSLSSKHAHEVDQMSSQAQQRLAAAEASEQRWRADFEAKSRELALQSEQLQSLRVRAVWWWQCGCWCVVVGANQKVVGSPVGASEACCSARAVVFLQGVRR